MEFDAANSMMERKRTGAKAPMTEQEDGPDESEAPRHQDAPPRGEREATPRPRERTAQASAEVTDTSRAAAEEGKQPYAVWSSERTFILSSAAAGIGLGNLWRFPTLVGEHGGGAFLLAYTVAVVLVAIPFAALELAAGRQAHGSVIASFRRLGPRLAVLGWTTVLLTLLIDSYYFVVTGWTFGFAVGASTGTTPDFESFTSGYASLWWLAATGLVVGTILVFGLSGIERVSQFLMPLLVLSLLSMAALALSGEGAEKAVAFLFSPQTARLGDPDLWRAAFGQAFFSMTIGQGSLITYGSYLPARINVPRSVLAIAMLNSGVALLAGLAIFPLVFAAGLDPAAGAELAFATLPRAFDANGSAVPLATMFFWLLFLAALSSCIGGAKVVVAALREQWQGLGSKTAALVGIAGICVLGVPSALSYAAPEWRLAGTPLLDGIDSVVGSNGTILMGIATSLVLGWRFSRDHLQRQFGLRGPMALALAALVRIAPLALIVLFGAGLVTG